MEGQRRDRGRSDRLRADAGQPDDVVARAPFQRHGVAQPQRKLPAHARPAGRCRPAPAAPGYDRCARTVPARQGPDARRGDLEPPARLPPGRLQRRASRRPAHRHQSGRCTQAPPRAQAPAELPAPRRDPAIARCPVRQVPHPVRVCDLQRPAQGRTAGAAAARPRVRRRPHLCTPFARPRSHQIRRGGRGADGGGTRAVPAGRRECVTERPGVPERRRQPDARGHAAGGGPAPRDGPGGAGRGLCPRLPAQGLLPPRTSRGYAVATLPSARPQTLAQGPGASHPVPRSAPHDCVAADDGGGKPGRRAAHPAPRRPAHHDGDLRAPGARLPACRDRPPALLRGLQDFARIGTAWHAPWGCGGAGRGRKRRKAHTPRCEQLGIWAFL